MHLYFTLLRFYPYWALPTALAVAEVGMHFRRKKSALQYSFFAISVGLVVGILLWVFYRGDLHSDEWVRYLID